MARGARAVTGRLDDDRRAARLGSSITSGVVIGVGEIAVAASFAALIFSGPLAVHARAGIGLALFAAFATMAVTALWGTLPGVVGTTQESTVAILAVMAASIATMLPPSSDEAFFTVVAAIALTSIATGAAFILLGRLKLGQLVRFVPYPVVGGFLAGTGWLLVKGGAGVVTDIPLTLANVGAYWRADTIERWLPAAAFVLPVALIAFTFKRLWMVPLGSVAATGIFYAVVYAVGGSAGEAERAGWLLGPLESGGLWRLWTPQAITDADWSVVLGQAANIATLIVVGIVSLLLNASGIELIARRDLDINHELRVAGAANVASGVGGGIVGFQSLSLTAFAFRSGAPSRLVGGVATAVTGFALLAGAPLFVLIPRLVLGGLLMVLGVNFLVEWVLVARRRLPPAEYLVVIVILLVIAAFGFLQGVGVGLVAALLLFVVNYSRTDVVRRAGSGVHRRSKVDRVPAHREALRDHGGKTFLLELQGFVFFGTANAVLERIRRRLQDPELEPLRFLVLDFRRVTGIDASAALTFTKVRRLARSEGYAVVLSGITDRVRRVLGHGVMPKDAGIPFSDLDRALQWCEDRLLESAGQLAGGSVDTLPDLLRAHLGSAAKAARLMGYLERVEVPAGHELLSQGEATDDVYFIERGQLTVMLKRNEGDAVRLRTLGPGTVVGELSVYAGGVRTAAVIAEHPSVLYRLTHDALASIERRDSRLASALHRLFARLLAERLADTLGTVDSLLD